MIKRGRERREERGKESGRGVDKRRGAVGM